MNRSRTVGPALIQGLLVSLAWSSGAGIAWAVDPAGPERVHDPALLLDTAGEGATVNLTDLGDGPYLVVPIFTRCRAVCSLVAKSLKSAWGESGPDGASARIVMVSFDPEDTQADMAHFRELFDLPGSWNLATLEREDGLTFFSELGFQWRTLAKRQFDHSGKIFVLTDELRIAAVLGPDQLTAERLGAEVIAATTGASLARRVGTHWVGFFGVGVVLLTLVVAVAWDRVRSRRRTASVP